MSEQPPSWFQSIPGSSNVLVLAPHGGITEGSLLEASAVGRSGNDLHTAALAEEFAARLGASALINPCFDRNVLDLNRVKDVRTRAPWFLEQIEESLDPILARHPRAVLLFVVYFKTQHAVVCVWRHCNHESFILPLWRIVICNGT